MQAAESRFQSEPEPEPQPQLQQQLITPAQTAAPLPGAMHGEGGEEEETAPAYFHIAPNGQREPFSADDNAAIFAAQQQGAPAVRIADVTLPNGRVLEFEIRFGDNAVSERMPQPSRTGICQVNLGNQNTRIVEQGE